MTLHPLLTRSELTAYCQLCHENGVKSVKVDEATANAIKALSLGAMVWMSVKFKVK